jgi:hypothetical protein
MFVQGDKLMLMKGNRTVEEKGPSWKDPAKKNNNQFACVP